MRVHIAFAIVMALLLVMPIDTVNASHAGSCPNFTVLLNDGGYPTYHTLSGRAIDNAGHGLANIGLAKINNVALENVVRYDANTFDFQLRRLSAGDAPWSAELILKLNSPCVTGGPSSFTWPVAMDH